MSEAFSPKRKSSEIAPRSEIVQRCRRIVTARRPPTPSSVGTKLSTTDSHLGELTSTFESSIFGFQEVEEGWEPKPGVEIIASADLPDTTASFVGDIGNFATIVKETLSTKDFQPACHVHARWQEHAPTFN